MTRIDGRGPKPQIAFIDDWSALKAAMKDLREGGEELEASIGIVLHYVPMLMDAYSEAWELMSQMMAAWEKLEESKDSLYVPDAQELVAGVANPERTRR